MASNDIAAALERVHAVLTRRPETGLHDDASATAQWRGGLGVEAWHANGTRVSTDMPRELGGSGEYVTPGWFFRAGVASCATTSIAMAAATAGIELSSLEVKASSRSDTRGVLGMADAAGERVYAGPLGLVLDVRIAAAGVDAARLQALVDGALSHSPIPCAVAHPTALSINVEISA